MKATAIPGHPLPFFQIAEGDLKEWEEVRVLPMVANTCFPVRDKPDGKIPLNNAY